MATACVVAFIFKMHSETGLNQVLHTTMLTLNKEFKRAYYRGRAFPTAVLVVYALKNRRKSNRLGLTATKKVGKAVERNRARRVMKEAYRLLEDEFPIGYDYVLVARTKTATVATQQVMKAMQTVIAKMNTQK